MEADTFPPRPVQLTSISCYKFYRIVEIRARTNILVRLESVVLFARKDTEGVSAKVVTLNIRRFTIIAIETYNVPVLVRD